MSGKIRQHLRSNVIGYVSLFVALSGTAYAVDGPLAGQNMVGSADIINNDVSTADVANETLTGDDIKNASLNGGEISPATLGIREIIGNSLTHQVIADDAIRTNELAAGAVTAPDVGPNAIPADGLGTDGSSKLATDSVDFDEIAAGAVHGIQVQDNSLTGTDIAESTLSPSVKAFGNKGSAEVLIPSPTQSTGVLAKGVPNGTYVVTANLRGWLRNAADHDTEWLDCALLGNQTVIARSIEGVRKVGAGNLADFEIVSLVGWGTVNAGINNIFLQCKGEQGVVVDDPTITAIQVASVG